MAGFDWSIKTWADVAALATMIGGAGIILAFLQLRHQSDVARSTFENLFVVQYQQLIQRLPIMALLGEKLNDDDRKTYLQEFYHYVDLCNTQAYHRSQRRISDATWKEWEDGIQANFRRPELKLVWSFIAAKSPDEFTDLRAVTPPEPLGDQNPYARLA